MSASSAPQSPVTILVVEDEPGIRRLACQVLQRHGYKTLEAGDGAEALAILSSSETPIGVVLTDIRMPNLNGLELERTIREQWPAIPVLFMSGEVTREWVVKAVRDHPVSLLRKPFTAEDLLEALQEVLQSAANAHRRMSNS